MDARCLTCLSVLLLSHIVGFSKAAAPVVNGLPTTIYVGEKESGTRLLYIYDIIDPNSNPFTCTNTITGSLGGVAVVPNGDEFDLKLNTDTGKYELWTTTVGSQSFDPAVINTYTNSITCTDSNLETSNPLDVIINVVPNEQVTINNVEGNLNAITLNALSTGSAVTVKTVDSTSDLGHTLVYNLTSNPSFNPEFFTIDSSTGAIRTNRELKFLDASTPTVYLTITAYDTTDQIRVYTTQTVNLNNQNTIPTTTNMPLAETELETLAIGTVLFTVSVEDPDTTQTHTFRRSCTPVAGEDTFTIDANGNFIIAQTLDYESISFFNCSIYVHDGIHEGGPFTYELTVANDNEAPVFSDPMYYATTSEGAKGAVSFDPGFTCTDPDAGDSVHYDFNPVNNSDRFAINTAGIMTFNTNYDVDNNNMPTSVVLTVYCIDSGHIDGTSKTGSAQVTLTIEDSNDNTPTFSSKSYTIVLDQFVSPGSVIGSITPTDADSGTNADMTCSGTSGSAYSTYYTVSADCNVYLSRTIDFASGSHVTYVAKAVDDGSPKRTGTTTVDIIYQETATTTTTTTTAATTTPYNFWDHAGNIALFVFSLLAGLALLGLLTWCLLRMCCCGGGGGGCSNFCDCRNVGKRRSRYPPRQVTPDTPPRGKYRNESHYSERYANYDNPQPKLVQGQREVQVVRSINRPGYMQPMRPPGGYVRSAPSLPGYFP